MLRAREGDGTARRHGRVDKAPLGASRAAGKSPEDDAENRAASANRRRGPPATEMMSRRKGIIQTAMDRKRQMGGTARRRPETSKARNVASSPLKPMLAATRAASPPAKKSIRQAIRSPVPELRKRRAVNKPRGPKTEASTALKSVEPPVGALPFSPQSCLAVYVHDWKLQDRAFDAMRAWKAQQAVLRQAFTAWAADAAASKAVRRMARIADRHRLRVSLAIWHDQDRLARQVDVWVRWKAHVRCRHLHSVLQRFAARRSLKAWSAFVTQSRRLLLRSRDVLEATLARRALRLWRQTTLDARCLQCALQNWRSATRQLQLLMFARLWSRFAAMQRGRAQRDLRRGVAALDANVRTHRFLRGVILRMARRPFLRAGFDRWTCAARQYARSLSLKRWRAACGRDQLRDFVVRRARWEALAHRQRRRTLDLAFRGMKLYASARKRHRYRKARRWFHEMLLARSFAHWVARVQCRAVLCRWRCLCRRDQLFSLCSLWQQYEGMRIRADARTLASTLQALRGHARLTGLRRHLIAWHKACAEAARKRRLREAALQYRVDRRRLSGALCAWKTRVQHARGLRIARDWRRNLETSRAFRLWAATAVSRSTERARCLRLIETVHRLQSGQRARRAFMVWVALAERMKRNASVRRLQNLQKERRMRECFKAFAKWTKRARKIRRLQGLQETYAVGKAFHLLTVWASRAHGIEVAIFRLRATHLLGKTFDTWTAAVADRKASKREAVVRLAHNVERAVLVRPTFSLWFDFTLEKKSRAMAMRRHVRRQKRRVCAELRAGFRHSRAARLHYVVGLLRRCLCAWATFVRRDATAPRAALPDERQAQVIDHLFRHYANDAGLLSGRRAVVFARDFGLLPREAVDRLAARASEQAAIAFLERNSFDLVTFVSEMTAFLGTTHGAGWLSRVAALAQQRFEETGEVFPASPCPADILLSTEFTGVVFRHRVVLAQLVARLSSTAPDRKEQEVRDLVALAGALHVPCDEEIARDLYERSSIEESGLTLASLVEWLVRLCKLSVPVSQVAASFDAMFS